MSNEYEQAAVAIHRGDCVIAVTGAGISAESGIPTFRGPEGIWARYSPEEYASIDAYIENPNKVWRFWCELAALVRGCGPNPGHEALAKLEQAGFLDAVITQNVDNLHQLAGSRTVIEYHGNAGRLVCLKCRARRPINPENVTNSPPLCHRCNNLMKPDVVMFGEDIPPYALYESSALAQKCDVMVVVGTSAQVYPAAELPHTAKANGAYIIESNTERTHFTDTVTDAFLEGPAGETLPRLTQCVLDS